MMSFVALALATTALFSSPSAAATLKEETKTLDQLYADAVAEGGQFVLYAGGDVASQQTGLQQAFLAAFPKVNYTVVTDYSKYHDVRVDNQLETDTLIPDVVALQTVQDFPRWEKEGKLLAYKPAGFSQIYDGYKSASGAWMSHMQITFSFFYDAAALAAAGLEPPTSPEDLVDPQYFGHIASSYPNDDDAVLYLFSRYVNKYGWNWVSQYAGQNVSFNRGTNTPGEAVRGGRKLIGVGASGSVVPSNSSNITFVSGINASFPYLTWGQRVGILKKARHPAAAKLFLNWVLSKDRQTAFGISSVRKDVTPPAGFKHLWEYPNAGTSEFPKFMEDRAALERWKQTFSLYIGEVQGPPSPGFLGLHPGA